MLSEKQCEVLCDLLQVIPNPTPKILQGLQGVISKHMVPPAPTGSTVMAPAPTVHAKVTSMHHITQDSVLAAAPDPTPAGKGLTLQGLEQLLGLMANRTRSVREIAARVGLSCVESVYYYVSPFGQPRPPAYKLAKRCGYALETGSDGRWRLRPRWQVKPK